LARPEPALPHPPITGFTYSIATQHGGQAQLQPHRRLPSAINETAVFIRGEYAFRSRPLWLFVSSTLYAAFLAGETGPARIATITWDASLHDWGMVLRWWDNRDSKVFVSTLPDTDDMRHQVSSHLDEGTLDQPLVDPRGMERSNSSACEFTHITAPAQAPLYAYGTAFNCPHFLLFWVCCLLQNTS
jgi:hypothetical protein